ncbi:MAG: hypothetical protein RL213_63 [Bacteroidota bacterium]|jgi:lipid-A-disaccharide synthase
MRYYIIAGEASGDLHASNLMRELRRKDPSAEFRCWGGDLMQQEGGVLVRHFRDLAFMGFAEVLMNIRTILRNLKACREDILSYSPDVLILVDYPGFNLRIARFAHENGIRVVYYISPQAWAWKESRVNVIKKVVDRMLVILPFEVDFYRKHHYPVHFVGHPLLDAVERHRPEKDEDLGLSGDARPLIALLPGSRRQEILAKLPIMLSVVDRFPEYRFVIAGAPSLDHSVYEEVLKGRPVPVISGNTYGILRKSHAALVTSGTATLETALFNVPQVVCYKANPVSYSIAKRLVKIRFISLVNLIMDREIVRELIQQDLDSLNLERELRKILEGPDREKMLLEYVELRKALGGPGASAKAADIIIDFLTESR